MKDVTSNNEVIKLTRNVELGYWIMDFMRN